MEEENGQSKDIESCGDEFVVSTDDGQTKFDPCPDERELKFYASGDSSNSRLRSIIACHVDVCASCRRRLEKICNANTASGDRIKLCAARLRKRQEELAVQKWRGHRPGTLWRTVPESEDEIFGPLVFVIENLENELVSVAEVSEDIAQAIQTDMVPEPRQSGLSFRSMVRGGNVFETIAGHLKSFAGQLPPPVTVKVIEFCRCSDHFDDDVPLSKYKFGRDSGGTALMYRKGITSGMLVTQDEDPRLGYLDSSKQRCGYLHDEGESSYGSDGPILADRASDAVAGSYEKAAAIRERACGLDLSPELRTPTDQFAASTPSHADVFPSRQLKGSDESQETTVPGSFPKRRKRFVKLLSSIAALLVLVVSTAKITQLVVQRETAPELGMGLATRPSAHPPTDILTVNNKKVQVAQPIAGFVNAGSSASIVLLKRMRDSAGNDPLYYISSHDPVVYSLNFAFFQTDNLDFRSPTNVVWCCDSLLIPFRQVGILLGYRAKPFYVLSKQSLISIAAGQKTEEMAGALTKATVTWVMRYGRAYSERQSEAKKLVQEFESRHKELYQELAQQINKSGYQEQDTGYWPLVISEIIARHPYEAASLDILEGWSLSLRRPLANIMINALITLESFPEMRSSHFFKETPLVPPMYEFATDQLRKALREVFGEHFEKAKKLARREFEQRSTRESFPAESVAAKWEMYQNAEKWINLRSPDVSTSN